MKAWAVILLGCTLFAGCDQDRLAKLEKENAELKAKLEKQSAAENLELQAKCSKDSRIWFNQNYSRDRDTALLDFTNHYNVKQNKCFILVEYHITEHDGVSWMNDQSLYDIYENSKYGYFLEDHIINFKNPSAASDTVTQCVVYGTKCKTQDEFSNLTNPYMND